MECFESCIDINYMRLRSNCRPDGHPVRRIHCQVSSQSSHWNSLYCIWVSLPGPVQCHWSYWQADSKYLKPCNNTSHCTQSSARQDTGVWSGPSQVGSQITMLICFVVFGSRPIVAGDVYQRRDDVRSRLSYRQINIHILTPLTTGVGRQDCWIW